MTETRVYPWLSVVTVVMNDLEGFLATKDCLLAQEFKDFEWIIIDSSDTPLSPDYGDNVKYAWVTPEGIFSAMNKGLELSKASYIYFLNAGDRIREDAVLQKIFDISHSVPITTAIYGDVCFVDERGFEVVPEPFVFDKERSNLYCKGRFPPHQGTFTPRESLNRIRGFDEKLSVAGDYKAFIDLSRKIDYLYAPIEIAIFQLGGASSKKRRKGIWEFHQARKAVFRPKGLAYLREYICTMLSYLKFLAFGLLQVVRKSLN